MPYEATHTLKDGTTVSGDRETVQQAIALERDQGAQRAALVAQLRADGVKAAHPDDGWVNRADKTVHLAYPYFNDGLAIGDRLALDHWRDGVRVVRVVGSEPNRFDSNWPAPWHWKFEDL